MHPIQVYLIDDHPRVIGGIKSILSSAALISFAARHNLL